MPTLILAPVRLFCFDPDLITLKSRNVFRNFCEFQANYSEGPPGCEYRFP
jgi:hypothetical protein